ncbi:hypothetical protein [Candidatus Enterovibrio escicola]|uniref:hypothetical protein n=1 Tax=Candidatus Enterovibrio escicola TaxID=1927127 RepID=UPI000BE34BBF|nr:hypothetical protein [Candidatus Enterovibrio escacola]
MEGGIYNINKPLHHCIHLLIWHLSDTAEFIGFIHHGKKKRLVLNPDENINLKLTKLSLFVCNIRLFLNANTILYLYLIVDDHLHFEDFPMMICS